MECLPLEERARLSPAAGVCAYPSLGASMVANPETLGAGAARWRTIGEIFMRGRHGDEGLI